MNAVVTTGSETARAAGGEVGRSARLSAVDSLVLQIRELIQAEGLGVGDSLPSERHLGLRFSAGRNTVREAVRMLKAYGLVDVRPKVGAIITDRRMDAVVDLFSFGIAISRNTYRDFQHFRRLVEVGVVDELFHDATDEDLAALGEINDRMRDDGRHNEPAAGAKSDFAFHFRLLQIAGNRTLLDVYRIMEPVMLQLMRIGKSDPKVVANTFADHAAIVAALAARDRVAFQYRMSRHLDYGLGLIEEREDTDSRPGGSPARSPAGGRRKQRGGRKAAL